MSATVTTTVANVNVGPALAGLEHHADIHVVDRRPMPEYQQEMWTLRSERFPAEWDGKEVTIYWTNKGLSHFEPVKEWTPEESAAFRKTIKFVRRSQ